MRFQDPLDCEVASRCQVEDDVCRLGGSLAGAVIVVEQRLAYRLRATEIRRQVMIATGSLVVLGVLLGQLVASEFYAVPAFVGAGLIFAGISGWCGMAKLLALMPWNRPSGAAA
ncbi:MAG: DUF2892 domain-containing protein [Hyphomicrobiaceae bacterium]